jgi:hypothetical protein
MTMAALAPSSSSPLESWLAEWPSVRAGVDDLVLRLKRRQLVGSYETAKRVMELLSHMVQFSLSLSGSPWSCSLTHSRYAAGDGQLAHG